MPWTERTKVQERLMFIARLEQGEGMTELCREFGISRKTGYKFWRRYREDGPTGLEDLRRRPYSNCRMTKKTIVDVLLSLKREKPHWGSAKIRELFIRRYPNLKAPARSTIHCIFAKHDLVNYRRKRRVYLGAKSTGLREGISPNDLWCIDFKGQFQTQDKRYCYPLTVTDHASRYILACDALLSTKASPVFEVFEEVFDTYGVPNRIRSDNGSPFASSGLLGLSKLSVWFLRQGISLERIEPGKPQQNGRHERMHRTLKQETANPSEDNILKQQDRFERFVDEFNNERPHEGLDMKTPSEIYKKSKRRSQSVLRPLEYPDAARVRKVTKCGAISFETVAGKQKLLYLTRALAGESVGLSEVEEGLWHIRFMNHDLGILEEKEMNFVPIN